MLAEYDLTKRLVLAVTGHDRLLADRPVLSRAVALRDPYVDALSYLQLRALAALRAPSDDGRRPGAPGAPAPADRQRGRGRPAEHRLGSPGMSDTQWRTHRLELDDQTLREWDAAVLAADAEGIVLDRSAFYPGGGGQPPDHGVLLWGGVQTRIVGARKGDDLYLIPAEGDPLPPAWHRRPRRATTSGAPR